MTTFPASSQSASSGDGPICACSCYDTTQALIFRSRLEAESVAVFALGEIYVGLLWIHLYALGGIRLEVRRRDFERARELIEALLSEKLSLSVPPGPVPCPNCGSGEVKVSKWSWRLAFLFLFFLNLPLPFRSPRARCRGCGRSWRVPTGEVK